MVYQIEIVETNTKLETIEAESKAEALAKVRLAYESEDIKLTDENSFVDVNFNFI